MKLLGCICFSLLFISGQCWAASESLDIPGDRDSGAMFPLSLDAVSGNSEGAPFISVSIAVQEPQVDTSAITQKDLDSTLFSTSYSRGIGTTPKQCADGFDEVLGLCAEICPTGYTAAIGQCWQNCPKGWADIGLFCAKWFMKFSGKDIFGQKLTATSCAEGLVKEGGRCYEPCNEGFKSSGPLCYGDLNNSGSYKALNSQVSAQHQTALAKASTGGIEVPDGLAPELNTTVVFAPVACQISTVIGTLGFIPDAIPDPIDFINDSVNNAIKDAMGDWADPVASSAWYIPSIANTVLFDLSADAVCEDDGQIAQAHMTLDPSITVEVKSSLFDTALHDLSGVDVGVMSVSIYELIPFRIYGSVGATMSAPTELTSVIDRSLPPLLINGKQYPNKTALIVDPGMEMWLSTEAYLRVTSLFNFIPDLLQLGTEFNLEVLNVKMPYIKEEGLGTNASGYEIYREESLISDLSAGSGSLDSFLRVLGVDTNAFGGKGDFTWDGYHRYDELISKASSTNISL